MLHLNTELELMNIGNTEQVFPLIFDAHSQNLLNRVVKFYKFYNYKW